MGIDPKDKKKEKETAPKGEEVLTKEDFLKTLKKVTRPVEKKEDTIEEQKT